MKLIVALAAAALLTAPGLSAPCRDTKGKFVKCPPTKTVPATRCRDAKGKFTACKK